MYAVIKTGGKQYRVAEGDRLEVELLGQADGEVTFTPVLVVDGDQAVTGSASRSYNSTRSASSGLNSET